MTGDPDRGNAPREEHVGARARPRLVAALALVGGYFVVELVAGLWTNSLALLSDAGHMFTDVLGLSMALGAIAAARRGSTSPQRSFGWYRLEILATLANTLLLTGVAVAILVEAFRRFAAPPEVAGTPMLVVAVVGLGVNLVVLRWLHPEAGASLNVAGARMEVLADTLGSVGAIAAAIVLQTTGFRLIDPIVGIAIGAFVLPRAWHLATRALRILIQAAPPEVDLPSVASDLAGIPGVTDVHDLHVWTLTSGMEVASVHLRLGAGGDGHAVLDHARSVLRDRHDVAHATVQVEPSDHAGCDDCATQTW